MDDHLKSHISDIIRFFDEQKEIVNLAMFKGLDFETAPSMDTAELNKHFSAICKATKDVVTRCMYIWVLGAPLEVNGD